MHVQPYLYFNGRCEEAVAFYRATLGAEATMQMRFKESPAPQPPNMPAGFEEKIMHTTFRIGDTTIHASDGNCNGSPKFDGISLALYVPTEEEAERVFSALGEGGHVQMPLVKTFFAPRFGMVADRFGVSWLILARPEPA